MPLASTKTIVALAVVVACLLPSALADSFKRSLKPLMRHAVDIDKFSKSLSDIEAYDKARLPSYVQGWLKHEKALVRHKALVLYKTFGTKADVAHVARQSIVDKDESLRELSASVAGTLNNNKAPDVLINALAHRDNHVVTRAAVALGAIGDVAVAGALSFALSNSKARYDAYIFVGDQRSYIRDYDVEDGRLHPVVGTYGVGTFMGVKNISVTTYRRIITQSLNALLPEQKTDNWQEWASRYKALSRLSS